MNPLVRLEEIASDADASGNICRVYDTQWRMFEVWFDQVGIILESI